MDVFSAGHDAPVPIGTAARVSGVKVPTIRFYEEIGLLRPPPRTEGNRRLYDAGELRRLAFIRHARELGFEIDAIRTLLALQDEPEHACGAADDIARARLADVTRKIASLTALKAELERMLEGCGHHSVADCKVIETLADHAICRHHESRHHESGPLAEQPAAPVAKRIRRSA